MAAFDMSLIRAALEAPTTRASEPKIVTEYWPKPIPLRQFDWVAVTDDYDGAPDSHCPVGYGRTEAEAVADLKEQLGEEA